MSEIKKNDHRDCDYISEYLYKYAKVFHIADCLKNTTPDYLPVFTCCTSFSNKKIST